MTTRFDIGDRVRIDIPDETNSDFHLHRQQGEIIEVLEESTETGDDRGSVGYRVELDDGRRVEIQWQNVRPL